LRPHPREPAASEKCYQDLTHLTSLIKEENEHQQRLATELAATTTATTAPAAAAAPIKKIAGALTRSDKYKAQLKPLTRTDQGKPETTLSVVVPAYNESERLPIMMTETLDYLEAKAKGDSTFTYEILIIDDGSHDATVRVALEIAHKEKNENIRVVSFEKNRGKGGSVTQVK